MLAFDGTALTATSLPRANDVYVLGDGKLIVRRESIDAGGGSSETRIRFELRGTALVERERTSGPMLSD